MLQFISMIPNVTCVRTIVKPEFSSSDRPRISFAMRACIKKMDVSAAIHQICRYLRQKTVNFISRVRSAEAFEEAIEQTVYQMSRSLPVYHLTD